MRNEIQMLESFLHWAEENDCQEPEVTEAENRLMQLKADAIDEAAYEKASENGFRDKRIALMPASPISNIEIAIAKLRKFNWPGAK